MGIISKSAKLSFRRFYTHLRELAALSVVAGIAVLDGQVPVRVFFVEENGRM